MPSRSVIVGLLASGLLLPAAIVVLSAFGHLLGAMGDEAGGLGFRRAAAVAGAAWVLSLVALVWAVAVRQLARVDRSPPSDSQPPSGE